MYFQLVECIKQCGKIYHIKLFKCIRLCRYTYILNQEYVLLKNRTVTIKQVSWGKRIDIIIYINDT